jgi:hypothetical protein
VDAESDGTPELVGALEKEIAVVGLSLPDAHAVVDWSGDAVNETELDGDPELEADGELDTESKSVVVSVAHADADAD